MSRLAQLTRAADINTRGQVVTYACAISALAFVLEDWIAIWTVRHGARFQDLLASASVANEFPAILLLIATMMNLQFGNKTPESQMLNKVFAIAAIVLVASSAYGLGYIIVTARSVLIHQPRYLLTGSFTTILIGLVFAATAFRTTLTAAQPNTPGPDSGQTAD